MQSVTTGDDVDLTIRTSTEGAVHELVPLRHARTVSANAPPAKAASHRAGVYGRGEA